MGRLGKRLNCVTSADDTAASLNGTERLYAKQFTDSWQQPFPPRCLWTSCLVLLISCAPTNTDASEYVILRVKRVCACYVLYEGGLIALSESGMILRSRSGTFPAQNLFRLWVSLDSRRKLFLNVFLALNTTVLQLLFRCLAWVCGSVMQWLGMSCCFHSWKMALRTYLDSCNPYGLLCTCCGLGCRATSFEIVTSIPVVSVSGHISKFACTSPALSWKCLSCNAVSMTS